MLQHNDAIEIAQAIELGNVQAERLERRLQLDTYNLVYGVYNEQWQCFKRKIYDTDWYLHSAQVFIADYARTLEAAYDKYFDVEQTELDSRHVTVKLVNKTSKKIAYIVMSIEA